LTTPSLRDEERGATRALDYDAELRLHDEVLRGAYDIRASDHVLDVGCGMGQTTREAARRAHAGVAVGIDTSTRMIERARVLAATEKCHNTTYICADAEVYPFSPEDFDVVISRYGTMFFRDPVAAFTNVGRAMRRGGRLVMMVWQAHERNEWSVALERALGAAPGSRISAPDLLDPFSLADRARTEGILGAAGFADVGFNDVHAPVYYGSDVETALAWIRGFTCTAEVLKRLDGASSERLLDRLRHALAANLGEGGVWFDARAWIVTARRPQRWQGTMNSHPRKLPPRFRSTESTRRSTVRRA
jgi:SAM-dependent methyltransferase